MEGSEIVYSLVGETQRLVQPIIQGNGDIKEDFMEEELGDEDETVLYEQVEGMDKEVVIGEPMVIEEEVEGVEGNVGSDS